MANIQEIWKPIPLPRLSSIYEVSNTGKVRSVDRYYYRGNDSKPIFLQGRVMRPSQTNDGYDQITFSIKREKLTFRIAYLVYITFKASDSHIPKGIEIDHIDNNKNNNAASNLQLLPARFNSIKRSLNLAKSSKYTGVSWCKCRDKWQAHIRYNSKSYYLGKYECEEDAAKAYQEALKATINGTFKKREPLKKPTSQYRGVSLHVSGKWVANYKRKHLGLFLTEEAAYNAVLQVKESKAA